MYSIRQSAITVATGAAKTLLQLVTSATNQARVTQWAIGFNGINASDPPVLVQIMRQTTAGTMTALTPTLVIPWAKSVLSTAQHTATAEPTASDILDEFYLTPAGGMFEVQYPLGREIQMAVSTRLAIKVTPGTLGASISASAAMWFEEF